MMWRRLAEAADVEAVIESGIEVERRRLETSVFFLSA